MVKGSLVIVNEADEDRTGEAQNADQLGDQHPPQDQLVKDVREMAMAAPKLVEQADENHDKKQAERQAAAAAAQSSTNQSHNEEDDEDDQYKSRYYVQGQKKELQKNGGDESMHRLGAEKGKWQPRAQDPMQGGDDEFWTHLDVPNKQDNESVLRFANMDEMNFNEESKESRA